MKKLIISMILICFTFSLDAQIYTPGGTLQGSSGNNNVGIGTASPNARLDLGTGYGTNGEKFILYNDDTSGPLAGTKVGFYMDRFSLWNNSTFVFPTLAAYPGSFIIASKNTSNITLVPRVVVLGESGFVGIGTMMPSFMLDVKGTIRAREIKVDLTGADFVFEKDYKLMPLNELEQFIKEQKHLPDLATAKEMKENGTELGNLNSKLLQKMEEMTLYIIEQNEKNEQQSIKIQVLEEKIEKLETALK